MYPLNTTFEFQLILLPAIRNDYLILPRNNKQYEKRIKNKVMKSNSKSDKNSKCIKTEVFKKKTLFDFTAINFVKSYSINSKTIFYTFLLKN